MEQLGQLRIDIRREVAAIWQSQAAAADRYLLAADAQVRDAPGATRLAAHLVAARIKNWGQAIGVDSPEIDHPAWLWSQIDGERDFSAQWDTAYATFSDARQANDKFNAEQFIPFADFRDGSETGWTATGQGLRGGRSPSGELTITDDGDDAINSVLPAGRYTHGISQKLNGTLRSPVIPGGWRRISALVLGNRTSAFRLISNNCQLNYANYRALTFSQPAWVTFEVPRNSGALQTFAELVTKFDNPKFPDQLGTLGGDVKNDRIPWDQAAADPRSYFGIVRVVLHEQAEPPRPRLSPMTRLFAEVDSVASRADLARRYRAAISSAVEAWAQDSATDDDVYWLSWVAEHRLLDHSIAATPRLAKLVTDYRRIERERIRLPRLAAGVTDHGQGQDHALLERGHYAAPGRIVPRGYLGVLADDRPFVSTGSGRLQLAEAIATADNPLTARVMVNRVWHHLFGSGIVRTVDDFGRVGDIPSHPELLDHLATRFTKSVSDGGMGWSLKRLIREIALSQTFRMTGTPNAAAKIADPENRLLHHFPARRMEAEAIRDSILAISGRLQPELFGHSVQPFREEPNATRRLFAGPLDGAGRRSVYIKVNLMEGPRFLGSFNLPGGKITQGRRDVTNVPGQALTMLNDRFVLQQSEFWAQRLIADESGSTVARINAMFDQALGRPPTVVELERFVHFVETLTKLHHGLREPIPEQVTVWSDVAHAVFNLKEFIYIP